MDKWTGTVLRAAHMVLLALAGYSLLGAAAVVMGINGTGTLLDRHVPTDVAQQAQRLWADSGTQPSAWVHIRPAHYADPVDVFNQMPGGSGTMPEQWAQLTGMFGERAGRVGELTFWDPSWPATLSFLAVGVAPWLALAWLWWSLARISRAARTGNPFVPETARTLAIAGGLVFLGPTLLFLARLAIFQRMLRESTARDKADLWFQWERLPLWPFGVGLALLVLAAVWRQGMRMRDDLEGLV